MRPPPPQEWGERGQQQDERPAKKAEQEQAVRQESQEGTLS